jgi:hypothetical protein
MRSVLMSEEPGLHQLLDSPPSAKGLSGLDAATVSSQAGRNLEVAGRFPAASGLDAFAPPAVRGGTPVSGSLTLAVASGAERPLASELCSVLEERRDVTRAPVLLSPSRAPTECRGQLTVSMDAPECASIPTSPTSYLANTVVPTLAIPTSNFPTLPSIRGASK